MSAAGSASEDAPPEPALAGGGHAPRGLVAGLLGLLGLGAFFRLYALDFQSLGSSELGGPTLYRSDQSWADFLRHIVGDEHPPLYPVTMRLWDALGLEGPLGAEAALRLPSALVGVATLLLAWRLGRRVLGDTSALTWAAVMAVSYGLLSYAQSARPYALLCLWLTWQLVAALAVVHDLDRRTGRAQDSAPSGPPLPWPRVQLAFATGLAGLTHYIAVFPTFAVYALLGVHVIRRPGRGQELARLAATALGAGALFLPWYAFQIPHIAQAAGGDLWIGQLPLLGVAMRASQLAFSSSTGVLVLGLVPACLMVRAAWRRWRSAAATAPTSSKGAPTGFTASRVALSTLALALGAAALFSTQTPVLMPRTGLAFVPAWYLAVALAYARGVPDQLRSRPWRTPLTLGLLAWVGFTGLSHHFEAQKEDLRRSGHFIADFPECRRDPIPVAGFTPAIYRYYVSHDDMGWNFVRCSPSALLGERGHGRCARRLRLERLASFGELAMRRACPVAAWSMHKRLTESPEAVRKALGLPSDRVQLVRFHHGWVWLRRGGRGALRADPSSGAER